MTLSMDQWRFIAQRLVSRNDAEARRSISLPQCTLSRWNRDPEFLQAREDSLRDAIAASKNIMRANMAKAAEIISAALGAINTDKTPDHSTRLAAAKLLMQAQGILKERRVIEGDDDNPVRVVVTPEDLYDAMRRVQNAERVQVVEVGQPMKVGV